MTSKTANAMWKRLVSQYELSSQENKHLLLHKFMSYEYEEGHDVLSHITAIEALASQLAVPDAQIVTKITMTLPPSWSAFVTAWNNLKDNEKTIDFLTSRLQQEEALRKMRNMSLEETNDTAFFAKRRTSQTSRGGGKEQPQKTHTESQTKKAKCNFCRKANRRSTHPEEVLEKGGIPSGEAGRHKRGRHGCIRQCDKRGQFS